MGSNDELYTSIEGVVMAPTRFEEGQLPDRVTGELTSWSRFVTDVVQARPEGTSVVSVVSETALYSVEDVRTPQIVSIPTHVRITSYDGRVRVRITALGSTAKKPAARAS